MPTTTTPEVQFRTLGGVRLRYADTLGSRGPTMLLTSPWPESIYAFAPIWATLAEHGRLFRNRPAGIRRLRAPRRPHVSARDGQVPLRAHR